MTATGIADAGTMKLPNDLERKEDSTTWY
nr:unnamed protein product [Callosobruchus chinensis]